MSDSRQRILAHNAHAFRYLQIERFVTIQSEQRERENAIDTGYVRTSYG